MSNSLIPNRSEIPASDKWDLSTLYKTNEEWEADLAKTAPLTQKFASFKGKLKDSSQSLLNALKAYEELFKTLETVYCYASLCHTSDESDSSFQDMEKPAQKPRFFLRN